MRVALHLGDGILFHEPPVFGVNLVAAHRAGYRLCLLEEHLDFPVNWSKYSIAPGTSHNLIRTLGLRPTQAVFTLTHCQQRCRRDRSPRAWKSFRLNREED